MTPILYTTDGREVRLEALELAPDSVQEVRICHDSIYEEPADGDQILVEAIINVVTEVRKKD